MPSLVGVGLRAGAPDPLAVRQWVERTCAEQGVSVAVSDQRTIERLVALLDPSGASFGTPIAC
jgi:hypothetical protein